MIRMVNEEITMRQLSKEITRFEIELCHPTGLRIDDLQVVQKYINWKLKKLKKQFKKLKEKN